LPQVSPDSFGASGFNELTKFGLAAQDALFKLQAQRDETEVIGKTNDYRVRLAQLPDEIVKDENVKPEDRMAQFKIRADAFRDTLNEDANPTVQRTLSNHAASLMAEDLIHMQTADITEQTQRARATGTILQDQLAEREAGQIASGQSEAALKTRRERMELNARDVERRIKNPVEALAEDRRAQNKTWESVAQKNPDYIMQLQADVLKSGTTPAGMDPEHLPQYVSIAVSTMHASQAQETADLKRQGAQVKLAQDANARNLTADILEGKPIGNQIPALLRARGLDDAVGRTLAELQTKLLAAPDMTQYQKGLAGQMEASLSALKYDNQALQDGLEQGLQSEFLQGHILKEEFTHLMGVFRGVEEYKHQQGKELGNQDVTHAHANLVQRLRTTGPADKFDALSEQTLAEAGQFFYRRMNQQPTADPWKVMKEAEDIFRPAIEKRLGLSKTDKAQLDDAKMQGLTHTKAMSPAGLKAYRDKAQEQAGWNIVQEALKALPPPPPPGFFERLREMVAPSKERKAPGVMGE